MPGRIGNEQFAETFFVRSEAQVVVCQQPERDRNGRSRGLLPYWQDHRDPALQFRQDRPPRRNPALQVRSGPIGRSNRRSGSAPLAGTNPTYPLCIPAHFNRNHLPRPGIHITTKLFENRG